MLQAQLTDLLRRTGAAHGAYEENELNGVYDEDWPTWYAAWAIDNGLNDIVATGLDASALAALLVEINDAHQQSDQSEHWAQFTARSLVERYT